MANRNQGRISHLSLNTCSTRYDRPRAEESNGEGSRALGRIAMPTVILRVIGVITDATNRHKSRTVTIVGRSHRYPKRLHFNTDEFGMHPPQLGDNISICDDFLACSNHTKYGIGLLLL